MVHALGQRRQQFADANAEHAGGNGSIRTANVVRSVRLGVEHFELAGSAFKEDENARRVGTAANRRWVDRLGLIGPQPIGQRDAEQAKTADLQQLTARNPLAIPGSGPTDVEHGQIPSRRHGLNDLI